MCLLLVSCILIGAYYHLLDAIFPMLGAHYYPLNAISLCSLIVLFLIPMKFIFNPYNAENPCNNILTPLRLGCTCFTSSLAILISTLTINY